MLEIGFCRVLEEVSMRRLRLLSGLVALLGAVLLFGRAHAHQPYFEDEDFTESAPYRVADPTVSTAVYATLDAADDVDYFAFDGQAGQDILFAMSIPVIDGQAEFNPAIVVMGRGWERRDVPPGVTLPDGYGAEIVRDERAEAPVFFEPFSRTEYWDRQEQTLTLPADGAYLVAVLHEAGATGRYTFVIGDREVIGGDPLFMVKMRGFWTPFQAEEHPHDGGEHRAGEAHSDEHHADEHHGDEGHGDEKHDLKAMHGDAPQTPYEAMREFLRWVWERLSAHMPRT
jgi:hypothetical protein